MSIVSGNTREMMEYIDKLSIPQIQKCIDDGTCPAYLGVPAIQLKTQMQKRFEQQQLLRQPSPKDMPTVAQQVMQEAQMAQAAPGVEGLPSNLPQQYAEGGIIAFDEGGEVERYQNRGYTGTSDIERLIREIAAREGVDPDLMVRMAQTESNFNPQAVSPRGAAGVMQLMPGTAKGLGLSEMDRFDPTKNVPAGIRYFKQQLDKYGSPDLAAAAYNYGPGNLDKHLKQYGGLNPDALPTETQGYLGKLGLSPRVAAALTNIVPVSSAIAAETPRGIAQLAQDPLKTIPPITDVQMDQPPEPRGQPRSLEQLRRQFPEIDSTQAEPSSPFSRGVRSLVSGFQESQTNAELQQELARRFGPKASLAGVFMGQDDAERAAAIKLMDNVRVMPTAELRMALQQPTAVEALKAVGASRTPDQVERAMIAKAAAEKAPPAQPQKETQVAAAPTQQPGDIVPSPVDIMSYIEGAPEKIRAGMEDLVEKERKRLKEMSDPEYAAIEKRQAERRKGLEGQKEQNALNNALAFLSGVAGTRGHWSEALAKGGKDLLSSLVTTQAAERAAQDKFDEAEDALRLRKLADAKNDDKASKQYGKEYANLMLQGTKLQVEGAYHYNTNLINKFDVENKRRTLELGKQKLDIALAQAQAGNLKARAGVMAMGNKLLQAWETTSEKRAAEASVAEKYGKDWIKLPLKSEKRLQAEAELQQAKNAWLENNMALHAAMGTFGGEGTSGVKDFSDLI